MDSKEHSKSQEWIHRRLRSNRPIAAGPIPIGLPHCYHRKLGWLATSRELRVIHKISPFFLLFSVRFSSVPLSAVTRRSPAETWTSIRITSAFYTLADWTADPSYLYFTCLVLGPPVGTLAKIKKKKVTTLTSGTNRILKRLAVSVEHLHRFCQRCRERKKQTSRLEDRNQRFGCQVCR